MVTLLTLNYNDSNTTISFINNHIDFNFIERIVVIDNNSTDNSYEILSKIHHPKLIVLKTPINKGYGSGNNYGLKYIKTNYINCKNILLTNPDVIINEDALIKLDEFLSSNKEAVIAAPYMLDTQGRKMRNTAFKLPTTLQYLLSIGLFTSKLYHPLLYRDLNICQNYSKKVGAVSGSCFMLNIDKFLSFGGFDENIFLYCEEVVIGKKAFDNNWGIYLLPKITFIHNHSVSISKTFSTQVKRQKLLYKSKLYVLQHYFNLKGITLFLAKVYSHVCIIEYYFKERLLNKRQ